VLITTGVPVGTSVGKRTTMMTCMVTLNIPVPTWATDRFETLGGATISGLMIGVLLGSVITTSFKLGFDVVD
jgi:hypothetical protein